jgi:xylulokinase
LTLLGLDVGSSELKAAIYGEGAACLASTVVEYPPAAAGRSELHSELLWTTLKTAILSVVRDSHEDPIRAVALSAHGETFLPIDKDGNALGPLILNLDSRATAEMEEFSQHFGRMQLYDATGLPPHPMYTLPKIAWLRTHDRRIFEQSAKFLCIEDFVLNRVGVGAWIGSSLAARTLGLDLSNATWSPLLLSHAGISEDQLARVVPAGTPLGTGSPAIMRELGLPENTLWVSAGHDQSCSTLGAGGIRLGQAVDGTGTFECISIPLVRPLTSPLTLQAKLPCGRHVMPGQFLTLAYTPAGALLTWFRDQLGRDSLQKARELNCSAYDLLLQNVPDGPTGIFVFPHFLGTGTPWLEPAARGAMIGLDTSTTREAAVKATLEGITFEMRWNIEVLESVGVEIDKILAVGGGSKSAAWLQLKADIFGREVVVVPGQASSRGAAICAGVGIAKYQSFQEATSDMVQPGKSYLPRPATHERYRELFEQYKEMARKLYGFEMQPSKGQFVRTGTDHA